MSLNQLGVTDSPSGVLLQEEGYQASRRLADVGREGQPVLHDPPVHELDVLRVEGREARQHLEDQRPEAPPVDGLPVPAARDHLRGHVLGRPAEGLRLRVGAEEALLGEAKVREDDVPLAGQEEVLELQVAVEDAGVVEVLEAEDDLRGVEADPALGELLVVAEVEEKLPAVDKIEYQVELKEKDV